MSYSGTPATNQSAKWTWPMVVGLLLLAFALRSFALDAVPPGLTHDEIAHLDVARQIQAGDWRLLYPRDYGIELGIQPLLAASLSIWGTNWLAMRLPSLFVGMLGLVCVYVLAVRLFGQRIGLLTLGVATLTWWSIMASRVILREVLEVPLYALALYGLWRSVEAGQLHQPKAWRFAVSGGVALGLAQYAHTIPRGLFIVAVGFGVYLLVLHRAMLERVWRSLVLFVIAAEIIAAPMLITAVLEPGVDRLPGSDYFGPNGLTALMNQLRESVPTILGQFAFSGNQALELNLPGRPIFEPFGAICFGVGLLVALQRFRRPAYALALIVFVVSLLPSIVLDPNFPFTRMISAQTVTFAFAGIGLDAGLTGIAHLPSTRFRPVLAVVGLAALAVWNLFGVVRDMYLTWPTLNDVPSVYNTALRELSQYVARLPRSAPISQCTLWIVFPWEPLYHRSIAQTAVPYFDSRPNLERRWHDCRYSLVIPDGAQFIFAYSDFEPLSSQLGRFLATPWLTNTQVIPGVSRAMWVDARSALADQRQKWRDLKVAWPPEVGITATAQLPLDFNHAMELIGYMVKPAKVKPGGSVAVVTYWRVTGAVPDDLILFTHLYRTPTEVMAQQDQFDVLGSSLKPGDVFIQQHEFIAVPPDTPNGSYWLGVGAYHQDTGERWPIYAGDRRVADRIFLNSVQVVP